ncbi:MAG: hypothetical protein JW841_03385 [Deltaproteobacteria bacterium]|nr:hypothetical protein [Deltaproteobacteria bacterium]
MGSVYFIEFAPGRPGHFYILISNPTSENKIIISNLSTSPGNCGDNYTITQSELRCLSHSSFLRCNNTEMRYCNEIERLITSGKCIKKATLSNNILAKVQKTILDCRRVSIEIKDVLRQQLEQST